MKRLGNPYLRIVLLVVILCVWQEAVRYFAVPTYILPAPSAIGEALWRGVASLVYVQNLWITVLETVLGFVAGAALAFLLGTVLALSRRTEYYCYPIIIMFQSLPKVALAPLIVGLLVLAIGLSLGGPTGYAINPARDLGPRIIHAILPIPGKGPSDWGYAWVPVLGPLIGGALGSLAFQLFFPTVMGVR